MFATALLTVFALLASGPVAPPEPAAVAQQARTSDEEKALCKAFREAYRGGTLEERAEAVVTLDQASRELPDGGQGRLVAKTLADALEDDELAVRTPAVRALAWGRHVETVVDALPELLDELRNDVEKLATRPDRESRDLLRGTVTLYAEACVALGRHSDDRVVDYLEGELRTLRPASNTRVVSILLVGPIADGLLALGSVDAVEIVVKTTDVFGGANLATGNGNGRASAQKLHESLATFSDSRGWGSPVFSDAFDQTWRKWFKAHEDDFVEKLGKLDEPPGPPPYVRPSRLPDRDRPGRGERP